MTDTRDEQAFLATIRENPADDTARLVYADFIQERADADPVRAPCRFCRGTKKLLLGGRGNGDHYTPIIETVCQYCEGHGTVLDPSAHDRAEFIRLGVELATLRHDNDAETHQINKLRARETALLSSHPEWRPKCPACPDSQGYFTDHPQGDCHACFGSGRVGKFDRGLLTRVDVPTLATVFRQRCDASEQSTEWIPTAWARTELAPFLGTVTEVYCGDREPLRATRRYGWTDRPAPPGAIGNAHHLPTAVFARLYHLSTDKTWRYLAWFDTADAANIALARAVAGALRDGTEPGPADEPLVI